MRRWISRYQQSNPHVRINYRPTGSGEGIRQLRLGLADFAATDAALSDDQLKEMPPVIQLPGSAGPVCITYNLPGLKQPLRLRPATLAAIYQGKITNWHHPAIAKDNRIADLPNIEVMVAHRADPSGTTSIFTAYLDTVSTDWHRHVGRGTSIAWPVGVAGQGSESVTEIVREATGGIGYVELTYASHYRLPTAHLLNRAGKWIKPDPQATSAAIGAFRDQLRKDLRSPIVNPPASFPAAYPISGLTYLLILAQHREARKEQYLTDFVRYILTEGQDLSEDLNYARLPSELLQWGKRLLDQTGPQNAAIRAQ
jgi:phosphate transport system substrate-binding protein